MLDQMIVRGFRILITALVVAGCVCLVIFTKNPVDGLVVAGIVLSVNFIGNVLAETDCKSARELHLRRRPIWFRKYAVVATPIGDSDDVEVCIYVKSYDRNPVARATFNAVKSAEAAHEWVEAQRSIYFPEPREISDEAKSLARVLSDAKHT